MFPGIRNFVGQRIGELGRPIIPCWTDVLVQRRISMKQCAHPKERNLYSKEMTETWELLGSGPVSDAS